MTVVCVDFQGKNGRVWVGPKNSLYAILEKEGTRKKYIFQTREEFEEEEEKKTIGRIFFSPQKLKPAEKETPKMDMTTVRAHRSKWQPKQVVVLPAAAGKNGPKSKNPNCLLSTDRRVE